MSHTHRRKQHQSYRCRLKEPPLSATQPYIFKFSYLKAQFMLISQSCSNNSRVKSWVQIRTNWMTSTDARREMGYTCSNILAVNTLFRGMEHNAWITRQPVCIAPAVCHPKYPSVLVAQHHDCLFTSVHIQCGYKTTSHLIYKLPLFKGRHIIRLSKAKN
jgi:hypothetical protein